MDAIITFFQTLGNAFSAIIDFVVRFFSDLIYLIELLVEFAAAAPGWYTWIPPIVAYIISLTLSLIVVLRIAGRD